jgi:hypothetical protein
MDAELYPEGGGINFTTADVYDQADFLYRYCKRRDYTGLKMLEYWSEIMKMRPAILQFEIHNSPTYHWIRYCMNIPNCEYKEAPLSLAQEAYYSDNPERYEEDMNWAI